MTGCNLHQNNWVELVRDLDMIKYNLFLDKGEHTKCTNNRQNIDTYLKIMTRKPSGYRMGHFFHNSGSDEDITAIHEYHEDHT
ncbi:hypothetical protein FKM82_021303 [Ascaphus truei]